MTSRESITTTNCRTSASLKMILCLLSDPSCLTHIYIDLRVLIDLHTVHCIRLYVLPVHVIQYQPDDGGKLRLESTCSYLNVLSNSENPDYQNLRVIHMSKLRNTLPRQNRAKVTPKGTLGLPKAAKAKRTTLRIPTWSPTVVLTEPEDA